MNVSESKMLELQRLRLSDLSDTEEEKFAVTWTDDGHAYRFDPARDCVECTIYKTPDEDNITFKCVLTIIAD